MLNQRIALAVTMLSMAIIGVALTAETGLRQASPASEVWVGRWKADGDPGEGKSLVCKTMQVDKDRWTATFDAVCDKDYSFTMEVPGRRMGDRVEFAVTVDLGHNYGGEYHWRGAIVGAEFNGVYTNVHYNGTFQMVKSTDPIAPAGISCELPQTGEIASSDATQ